MAKRTKKPEYDKLSRSVQVLLKDSEYKIFERLRRELAFSTNAAYGRMIFLKEINRKRQTELISD